MSCCCGSLLIATRLLCNAAAIASIVHCVWLCSVWGQRVALVGHLSPNWRKWPALVRSELDLRASSLANKRAHRMFAPRKHAMPMAKLAELAESAAQHKPHTRVLGRNWRQRNSRSRQARRKSASESHFWSAPQNWPHRELGQLCTLDTHTHTLNVNVNVEFEFEFEFEWRPSRRSNRLESARSSRRLQTQPTHARDVLGSQCGRTCDSKGQPIGQSKATLLRLPDACSIKPTQADRGSRLECNSIEPLQWASKTLRTA